MKFKDNMHNIRLYFRDGHNGRFGDFVVYSKNLVWNLKANNLLMRTESFGIDNVNRPVVRANTMYTASLQNRGAVVEDAENMRLALSERMNIDRMYAEWFLEDKHCIVTENETIRIKLPRNIRRNQMRHIEGIVDELNGSSVPIQFQDGYMIIN